MEVVKLAKDSNKGVADNIRDVVERHIEGNEERITAWALTVVYADGASGTTFEGPAELALVGALDVTKQRIVEAW